MLLLLLGADRGYTSTPTVEIDHNEIWRRIVGTSGDGIHLGDVAAQQTFRDRRAVAHGVDYEYRMRAVGLNGAVRWSNWVSEATPVDPVHVPPFTPPDAIVMEGGDADSSGPLVLFGGHA